MTNPREPIEEQPCNSTSCSKSLWQTYHLLIFLALALTAGRITVVTSREGTPLSGANDRSRWLPSHVLLSEGPMSLMNRLRLLTQSTGIADLGIRLTK